MKDEKTGEDLVSIGFVVDLDYADATTSAHDLLQTFKMHPLVRKASSRAASASPGARRRCPAAATGRCRSSRCPARVLVGDAGGMVDTVALKGVHHCIKSGMLAAESIYAALKRGEQRPLEPTSRRSRTRSIGKELCEVRNTRQPLPERPPRSAARSSAC